MRSMQTIERKAMKIHNLFVVLSVFSSFCMSTCQASEPVVVEKHRTTLSFGLEQVLDGSYNKTASHPMKEVMHPEVLKQFVSYFSIMFGRDFPAPKHPEGAIVKGFDCLYDRCAEVNASVLPHMGDLVTVLDRINQELAANDLPEIDENVVKAFFAEIAKARIGLQKTQLNKTLALHKPVLEAFAKVQADKAKSTEICSLASEITGFPCDACKQGAAYELLNHGE